MDNLRATRVLLMKQSAGSLPARVTGDGVDLPSSGIDTAVLASRMSSRSIVL
jgi:hypothetical protein